MRTDVAYEMTRFGRPFPVRVGILQPITGGLSVLSVSGYDFVLTWEEDDQFIDDEALGAVEVITKDERWVFNVLGLDNWEEMQPFFDPRIPEFESDEAVNKYFYEMIHRDL